MEAAGTKYDGEKPRTDLFDPDFFVEVSKVLTFGAQKYAAHNWRGGIAYSRLFGAALRHLFAFWRGEDDDNETGLSHLAHAGCCIMFLWWHAMNRRDLDDRWHRTSQPHQEVQAGHTAISLADLDCYYPGIKLP